VESERINFLLNSSSEATQDDIILLEKEINEFPYSQVLHILMAKIQYQLDSKEKNRKLSSAAIYSCDRSILKKVIRDQDHFDKWEEIIPYQSLSKFTKEKDIGSFDDQTEEHESSSIFDEVLKNLEKLKSLRQQFQFLELNEKEQKSQEIPRKERKPQRIITKSEKEKSKLPKTEKPKKSTPTHKNPDQIVKRDSILDSQVNEYFLKDVEKDKETFIQENKEKNSDQNLIITKFIQEQPSIGSLKKEDEKSSDAINKDLSVKSTKFGDDLISENLAIILLKQGKKERSIEIYKKLIWKLPQKKAYFAARIEEIKN